LEAFLDPSRFLPSIVAEKNVTKNVHIMFNVYKNQLSRQTGSRNLTGQKTPPTFFSATIDDTNLIFGHKLHIGTPYRGKRFWTHQIPTSCLPTWLIFLMGPKTLTTIWGTYVKLVTKYQISAINSGSEKCTEK
jgi:hypothetical protein